MDTKAQGPVAVDEKADAGQVASPPTPQPQVHPDGTHEAATPPTHQQHDQVPAPRPPQHPVLPTFFGEISGTDGVPYATLRKRVTNAYKAHTYQYWFVAVLSNSLLFAQILIAASLTVLGAFNDRRARTATIFLGATNTVIAGLLTYFKSRNQPNRARQFRNDLGAIVDQLDDAEANFRNPNWQGNEFSTMEQIRNAYNQARTDAQSNYPDLWVRGTTPYNPNYTPRTETDPTTGITGGPSHPSRAQTWSPLRITARHGTHPPVARPPPESSAHGAVAAGS